MSASVYNKLTETEFTQLTTLNNSYKVKLEEYTNKLEEYKLYEPSSPKSVSDYDYWPGYTFNVAQPGNTGQPIISQTTCLQNCAENNNCLGASFFATVPPSTPSSGYCYLHSSLTPTEDQLITSPASSNNVAIVRKTRYYLESLKKINNELMQINSDRTAFYTSISGKIAGTQAEADASVLAFSQANAAFMQNKRDINKALTNLGTSDEQYNYNSSFFTQESLKFQLLLIFLYAIVFLIFNLFNVSSEVATMITVGTGIITIMIIVTNLYQYMQ